MWVYRPGESVSPHRVSDMSCRWIGKAVDPSTVCVKLSVPTEQSVWIHSNTKNWDVVSGCIHSAKNGLQ